MPKFKKNPNPIRQNFGVGVTENPDATSPNSSGFKMKYKHSAFPFKGSPTKHTVEEEIPQTTAVGVDLQPWMMLPQSGPPSGSSRQRGRKTKKHRYY